MYLEALVPVVSGLPFAQMVELELGVRHSDYEHTDEEVTWKALANWQINDQLRLRGGFNRATRAPNLGELFLNQQEVFTGGGAFGDACGARSNFPFGAGGTLPDPQMNPGEPPTELAAGQTAAGAQSTLLICQAMMGGAGSVAANQFYNVSNATGGAGGGFAWVQQQGNRALTSETADTWTFGAVASSPWENPWLSGLTASVDWYRYEIEDAIMLYSLDYAAYRCFGTVVSSAAAAQAQADTEACKLLPRDRLSGGPLTSSLSYDNQATIETQGFDVGVNWFGDLNELMSLPGSMALSLQATVLDYYKTKQSPAVYDVETDWAGSLGPNLSGTNGGAYDFRLFGTATYIQDAWSVSLRWRYLPEVQSVGWATQKAIIENNARVSAGGAGILLSYNPMSGNGGVMAEKATEDYNIFDFSFNWNVNETIALRGGITNLLDTEPSLVAPNTGVAPGSVLTSYCNGAPGCQNPTAYSMPNPGSYNAGYYDTLGRRFFVGAKVSF
jgi:outer membrane receptor protein involved in Fe transport